MKRSHALLIGLSIALIIFMLDQLSKGWVLTIHQGGSALIAEATSFFNIVLVWNRGVSFGMFSDHAEWMPIILSAVALGITAVLIGWLSKAHRRPTIYALGFVIGGAIGNVVDRVRFGAVVDFLDFHFKGYHWPAFNIADAAIFIGVVLLLIETIVESKDTEKVSDE